MNNACRRTDCAAHLVQLWFLMVFLWFQECKSLRRVASSRCDRTLCTDFMYMFIAFTAIYDRNQNVWYTFTRYPVLWCVRSFLEKRFFPESAI